MEANICTDIDHMAVFMQANQYSLLVPADSLLEARKRAGGNAEEVCCIHRCGMSDSRQALIACPSDRLIELGGLRGVFVEGVAIRCALAPPWRPVALRGIVSV